MEMLWDKQRVFQVEAFAQAKCKRQVRIQRVPRLKKIQYRSLNIKIKAKQSTETKEVKAGMRISPISSFCQFAKGFAMTAVGGVPGLKTEKMHQAEATSLEEMDPDIATW